MWSCGGLVWLPVCFWFPGWRCVGLLRDCCWTGLLDFLVLVIWIFLLWVAYCGLGPVCDLVSMRGVLVLGLVVCELVVGCFGFAGCVGHLNCFCLLDCVGCSLF